MSSRQAKVLRFSFQALTASLILFIDFLLISGRKTVKFCPVFLFLAPLGLKVKPRKSKEVCSESPLRLLSLQ